MTLSVVVDENGDFLGFLEDPIVVIVYDGTTSAEPHGPDFSTEAVEADLCESPETSRKVHLDDLADAINTAFSITALDDAVEELPIIEDYDDVQAGGDA